MVPIHPRNLSFRQEGPLNEVSTQWCHGQRGKAQRCCICGCSSALSHLTSSRHDEIDLLLLLLYLCGRCKKVRGRNDDFQVLNADAKLTTGVVPRFVGNHHGRLQRRPGCRWPRMDALRTLMNIQKTSHSVSCSVCVVEATLPQGVTSERIDSMPRDIPREDAALNGNVALENQRVKGALLSRRRVAREGHRPSDIRCPVDVLCAAVDEVQRVRANGCRCGGHWGVVNNRSIRTTSGDTLKAQ
mmetsp:Transcript_5978/g.6507  ORF Transcript_5978/g.6507 Transcript_5978/m.6507 type:complete len:243 (+) Transcript_5978:201-929(+)